MEQRPRQREAVGIALDRSLLDGRAAGKAQAEQPRHLVEGFARGVVQRAAQAPVAPVTGHQDQLGVPAGDDQHQRREGIRGGLAVDREPVGVDMAFQVIDREQRQPGRKGQPLGRVDAHQQTARQPRPMRDPDGVQLGGACNVRLVQRLADDGLDGQHVLAAGDFGKDAAKAPVQVDLRGDDVAVDRAPVFDDRGRGFVATGFDGKDAGHGVLLEEGALSPGRAAQMSSPSASTPSTISPVSLVRR